MTETVHTDSPDRSLYCRWCGGSLAGKRPQAKFCRERPQAMYIARSSGSAGTVARVTVCRYEPGSVHWRPGLSGGMLGTPYPLPWVVGSGKEVSMAGMQRYTVTCHWDDEAGVWYVAETDVPGLVTEADTLEQLEQKLKMMIPELLELNDPEALSARPSFRLVAEKDALALSA